MSLPRRLAAEALGTALLLAVVVGSGVMAQRLAGGNMALALLANALATGAGLLALILSFGPVSGAHFNPLVSLAMLRQGELSRYEAAAYVAVQFAGAIAGILLAHLMFELPLVSLSTHVRSGFGQYVSEFVASFGLLAVIISTARLHPQRTPLAVAAYIVAAYWFTASTAFANPAVTLARCLSDTFAGIRPVDVPGFMLAQLAGAGTASLFMGWLLPVTRPQHQAVNSAILQSGAQS